MKIGKSEVYSLLSFVGFWLALPLLLIEVLSSIGWLDPNQHLEHWFVAVLLAGYLPQLWRDSIPRKKSAMFQNAAAASAFRKGQRVEQYARGMAGTDASRDDEYGSALIGGIDPRCIGPSGPIQHPPQDTQ